MQGRCSEENSWLEIPKKQNGIPNLDGFEITSSRNGLLGCDLDVKETYGDNNFLIPTRTYEVSVMLANGQAQNAPMRAETVLAAWIATFRPT